MYKAVRTMLTEHGLAKYAMASVLIHVAVLSIALPQGGMSPKSNDMIEVFMMQEGGPASGNSGSEKVAGQPYQQNVKPKAVRPADKIVDTKPAPMVSNREEPPPVSTTGMGLDKEALARNSGDVGGVAVGGGAQSHQGGAEGGMAGAGSGSSGVQGETGSGAGTGAIGFGGPAGPRFLHREEPEYPLLARRRKKEGQVVLMVTINEVGKLMKVEVTEASDPLFVGPSVEAVKKSSFLPARINGVPVAVRAILPIRFSLKDS